MLGAVGSREHGMMGCVGAGSKRCFQASVGTVNPDLSLSLWLPCYSGPLNWFPERCCLMDSFDPAASPSFLHTTCKPKQRGRSWEGKRKSETHRERETGRHRGRVWKSKAMQGEKKRLSSSRVKTSNARSLTLSCRDCAHTHTHTLCWSYLWISVLCHCEAALWCWDLSVSEQEGAPGGPQQYYRATIVVLPRFLACHIPLQGPDSPALVFSLISGPFIPDRAFQHQEKDGGRGGAGGNGGEEEWRGEAGARGGGGKCSFPCRSSLIALTAQLQAST